MVLIDNTHRERISLGREWEFQVVNITTGQPFSDAIDIRRVSSMAVFIPTTMTASYLTVYSAIEENNAYWPVYDRSGTLLTMPVTAGGKVLVLPAEVFPLGWIKLVSCSDNANSRVNEAATRTLVVTVKP